MDACLVLEGDRPGLQVDVFTRLAKMRLRTRRLGCVEEVLVQDASRDRWIA